MPHRPLLSPHDIAGALQRVGELLQAASESHAIVVVGGAALNLLGVVERATTDVDIIAFAAKRGRLWRLRPAPAPLPPTLTSAIAIVARDLNLAGDWRNTGPASQWRQGLPRGLAGRIRWRRFAGLHVGIVARPDLIRFKLHAAVDADGPTAGRHTRDLSALDPTAAELRAAARWVKAQDAGESFSNLVNHFITRFDAGRTRSGR